MVDQSEHGVEVHRYASGETDQGLAQHREIVVVTQQIRQRVSVLGLSPHGRTTGRGQEPQVVPEVLDPFAPCVQVLGTRCFPRLRERLAPPPIAAPQPGLERVPAAMLQRIAVQARASGRELGCGAGHL